MNRVLMAGATGYLGRFVAREFKRRGAWSGCWPATTSEENGGGSGSSYPAKSPAPSQPSS
jgi:hypothetical protein